MTKEEKDKIKSEFLHHVQFFAESLKEMNFGKITIKDGKDKTKKITSLKDFLTYRGADESLINPKTSKKGGKNGR
jgi:hypothetical protein